MSPRMLPSIEMEVAQVREAQEYSLEFDLVERGQPRAWTDGDRTGHGEHADLGADVLTAQLGPSPQRRPPMRR